MNGSGAGLTVIVFVVEQSPTVCVIIAVPGETEPTTPVEALIVATVGSLLLQAPPEGMPAREAIAPGHKTEGPVMDGMASVTVVVVAQPVGSV